MDDIVLPISVAAKGDNTLAGGGEMGQLMRELDWSTTPLGAISTWPQSLRTAVSICLASYFPMLIWWGPELVMLYNDAYRPILGTTKHPSALGQRGRECWPEIWEIIGPMLQGVLSRGEATWSENQLLLLHRNGYAEECYFTFSYSPIRDETGEIAGVFTAVTETTSQQLNERRLRTLRTLSASMSQAQTPEEVCQMAADSLSGNPADLPFTLLYLLTPDGTQAHLAGTTRLPHPLTATPECILLADETAPWPFAACRKLGEPTLVNDLSSRMGNLFAALSTDTMPAPHSALVVPIIRAGQMDSSGFLVAGISPRRPLDEEYRGFLTLVADQIATALATSRAYQDAQERAQALAELDRSKTTFFSNVSHEFRTPLTLSLAPVETLLSDTSHPLVEEQRELLRIVQRNSLRQLKLVNTLLDYSRIQAGRIEAVYVPTDLVRLTTDLASAFRSVMEQAGLQLRVECAPLPEPIYVDREMWEKIVLNLLSNAFKFTFQGFVRVALYPIDSGVELVVQDSGGGVSPEELPHLFERFYRAHAVQARTQEGSGIGLALVQELVRLHGGSIIVRSTQDVGTTFTIRLPTGSSHLPIEHLGTARTLASTALGTDSYIEEALRWLPERTQVEGGCATDGVEDSSVLFSFLPSSPGRDRVSSGPLSRLLVVDDNADMRDYLKRLFSPSYQVLLAADGKTALALARGTRPDLILADVMMSGLDGFALLKALRAEGTTKAIPVILLSARAGEEATLEGLQAGAEDYLVKPFSAREVLARVQARLEIARLRSMAEIARERLYTLFMQAPAVICVFHGPEHIYELVNPLYQQIVGQRAILGKSIREALPELEGQGFYELLDQVYATGEPFIGMEMRVELDRHMTGKWEEVYFNFVYQPVRTGRGEIDGIMVHAVDVTEQVHLRQRMDTFMGIASHELKSPLTSIRANVQLARRRLDKAISQLSQEETGLSTLLGETLRMLERTERQILFQNRLVGDLVDTTRIQAGKLELRLSPTDLNVIIREAVEEQRQLASTRIIHLDLPEDGTLLLTIDADRIGQVVTNYLSNALKYSSSEREVSVIVSSLEDTVRVAVRDAGPGLDPLEQQHLWERFYRVPGIQVKSGSGIGLGLGLHICQTIITEHAGHVGVESTKGIGSTFWFTLSKGS